MEGANCFVNLAAAKRAATLLGVDLDELGKDIFSPPHSRFNLSENFSDKSSCLDNFVTGLYNHAVHALVLLINRSLHSQLESKGRSTIHVLDAPGFQHHELTGAHNGASFDDLCMNYVQERLQMLFYEWTYTSESLDIIQEEIKTEIPTPLTVIDTIDKPVLLRVRMYFIQWGRYDSPIV